MFEVGDLIQRKRPFAAQDKENLWIILEIDENDDWKPHIFITVMNTKNQMTSKFVSHIVEKNFVKVA